MIKQLLIGSTLLLSSFAAFGGNIYCPQAIICNSPLDCQTLPPTFHVASPPMINKVSIFFFKQAVFDAPGNLLGCAYNTVSNTPGIEIVSYGTYTPNLNHGNSYWFTAPYNTYTCTESTVLMCPFKLVTSN
jgi:hypothetical protein